MMRVILPLVFSYALLTVRAAAEDGYSCESDSECDNDTDCDCERCLEDDDEKTTIATVVRDEKKCSVRSFTRYRNLVFEGGGMRGIAHIGALEALSQFGYYDSSADRYSFDNMAGASVGCLFALATALDISPRKLRRHVLEEIDFYSLLSENSTYMIDEFPRMTGSHDSYFRLFDYIRYAYRLLRYAIHVTGMWKHDNAPGIDDGSRFMAWIRDSLIGMSPHANELRRYDDRGPTLEQLRAITGHALTCYASRLGDTDMVRLSVDNTPNAPIIDVVYASCSFPMLFKPLYDNKGHPIVDGGLLNNFPIYEYDGYDSDAGESYTLGLSLHDQPALRTGECACESQRQRCYKLHRAAPKRPSTAKWSDRAVKNLNFASLLLEAMAQDRDYLAYARDARNCDRVVYLASRLETLELTASKKRIARDIEFAKLRTRDFLSASDTARDRERCLRRAKNHRIRV